MLNKLLERQIHKYCGEVKLPERFHDLFQVISESYDHYEKDRKMLERAIDLSSDEMIELNARLRNETVELKKAHHEFKTLFENLEDVFFSIDIRENKVLQMSPSCEKIYGYPADSFYKNINLWNEVVVEEDKKIILNNYSSIHEGKRIKQEYRIIRKDGGIRWVESKITPTLDENGKMIRLDGLTIDITARKKAEEKILHNEIRFRQLIENNHDGIALISQERKLLYVTPSVSRIFGYSKEEVISNDLMEFIHQDDQARLIEQLENIMFRHGETEYASYRMLNKSGSWSWIHSNITNMLHEPSLKAIIFNFKDITERVKAQMQIEFDRRNRDALINSTNDLMWSIDKEMKLITANRAFSNIIKIITSIDINAGDNLLIEEGFPPETLKRWESYYKRALQGETFSIEEFSDNPYQCSTISLHPIFEDNKVIGASCFSKDITKSKLDELERVRITNDLIQRNKDLEQFAYIISHNLRGPVANILGLSAILQCSKLNTKDYKVSLKGLESSVKRLDEIIIDLHHILQMKREITELKNIEKLSVTIDNIKDSIFSSIEKEHVIIKTDFSSIDDIYTIKSYLNSVFYNLISNSIKYRKPGESAIIEITSAKENKKILINYKDNGIGIDLDAYGDKVFGLYKRFHMNIEGKGMGLYMVKNQIEALGGKINIKSEVNIGTEFIIEFEI